jgi:ABC-type uncharacterized transport system permease subunit
MLYALLAVVAYAAAAAWLARRLALDGQRESALAGALALVAVVLHAALHVLAYRAGGSIDLHFFAALSLVGVALAALTVVVSLHRPVGALGVVVYPIAAACLLLYAFGTDPGNGAAPGWQIQLHAWLALLAYATLSLAALIAVMLWMQERALRRRQLATLLHAFPPLTLLEALLFRLIGAGFALLTLALLSGAVFVENLFDQHLAHKTVLSLLAWGAFAALLFGRLRYGWRGRRAVRWTLAAMLLLGLAFFGSKFVLELVLQRTA